MKVVGWASRPVEKTVFPAPSVALVIAPASSSTLKPAGKTTVTLPPVAPSLARPQALNRTRLIPTRVGRVAAPPGSAIVNDTVKGRVEPAARWAPKAIRSSVYVDLRAATLMLGWAPGLLILK